MCPLQCNTAGHQGAQLKRLAPVGAPSRRVAESKSEQGAGVRRWPMVVSLLARAHAGAKSLAAFMGVAALGGLLLVPLHGDGARSHRAWAEDASFEPKVVASGAIDLLPDTQLVREQRVITEFIAKRYRVSDTAVANYVAAAYRAGEQYSLDPLLILAVMAVGLGYKPGGEST